MRILSRYLLKEHVAPFCFALGALTGLMLLNQIAKQFANLIGKGLPWGVIAEVFALSFPFMLAMTIPMAVLVAVLHAFSRLGADSEIVALKATGVHMGRFVAPVLVASTVLAIGTFLFVDQVLPRSNHKLKTLLVDIARKKPTFELKEQMVNEVVPGQLFLRAGRIDQAADRMTDVVLYDLANDQRRRTIYADSGYIRYNADRTDLYLTLFDGYAHDYDRADAAGFRRVFFRTDLVRVAGVSNTLQRTEEDNYKGDREMTVCEMDAIVRGDFRSVSGIERDRRRVVLQDALSLAGAPPVPADTTPPPAHARGATGLYCALQGLIGSWLARRSGGASEPPAPASGSLRQGPVQLPERPVAPVRAPVAGDPEGTDLRSQLAIFEARRRAALQHAATYQVEIHKKWSIAVSCIVFVLIGVPVALHFPRGGIGLTIGASVAIFGVYYIGLIGGETLADRLIIPPFWAMWAPNLLMVAIGAWLFTRLGRERATTRGGAWDELLRYLRTRLKLRLLGPA
ncbi:MAG TPA: LptF/LptG family permease [Gemmatimonadales bacterium]|nr:LptF/LptG family permease [Gemmatimonadales bacterium]